MSDVHGENTRALETPVPAALTQVPLAPPVHRATTFAFATAQDYADVLSGVSDGYCYARIDSPTADLFAAALAAMEGVDVPYAVVGQPFASGMAAISATLLSLTAAGRHVVAARELYGGTFSLLTRQLARFGVTTSFVDTTDLDAVRAAITDTTAVVWAETLANPTMTVADIPGLAEIAHAAGAVVAVDSTFASPAVCRPLAHGADLVVHSATKYIGGHSDVTGGAVCGRAELLAAVRAVRVDTGGSLSPDDAYQLQRGLQTLPLRVARHCETALAVATALPDHPRVDRIDYPGLTSHRSHALATRLFVPGRFGGVVTVTPRGGRAEGMAFCDRLRLIKVATSLGGTHSLVSHVASTTHRQLSDDDLAAAGIGPSACRISIGLEDPADLIADILDALG
jgi:cystathionine gamma-synthase/O-acetylhomoserine (thiol)-lyase